MSNRDLLKEAIADAKAVKEMAISNAKAALEEAFTPQLKSMLAKKLTEMEDEDEKEMKEMKHDEDTMSEEELNELLAELESEDDSEEPMKEEKEAEEEESEEEEKEEEFDLEEMSEEDLKAFIEEVVDEMIEAGELEAGDEGTEEEADAESEMPEEEAEEEPMMENKKQVNEVVGTAALIIGGLAALAGGAIAKAYKSFKDEQKAETEKMAAQLIARGTKPEEAVKQAVEKVGASMSAAPGSGKYAGGRGGFSPGSSLEEAEAIKESTPEIIQQAMDMLKSAGITNAHTAQMILAGLGAFGTIGGSVLISKVTDFVKSFTKGKSGIEEAYDETEEMMETIKTLKSELQEVNLLNSKLLYTNKIFKAKNLTEAQKVKVLSTFDKAESVKEVKLVYETLSEGFNTATTGKREAIKESKSYASKAVGVSPKQPVVETNDMVNRFKKLAGIK